MSLIHLSVFALNQKTYCGKSKPTILHEVTEIAVRLVSGMAWGIKWKLPASVRASSGPQSLACGGRKMVLKLFFFDLLKCFAPSASVRHTIYSRVSRQTMLIKIYYALPGYQNDVFLKSLLLYTAFYTHTKNAFWWKKLPNENNFIYLFFFS